MLITNHSGIVKVEGKLFIEAESAKDAVHSKKKKHDKFGVSGKEDFKVSRQVLCRVCSS